MSGSSASSCASNQHHYDPRALRRMGAAMQADGMHAAGGGADADQASEGRPLPLEGSISVSDLPPPPHDEPLQVGGSASSQLRFQPEHVQEPSVLDMCVECMQEEADQRLAFAHYEALNGEKFLHHPEGPLDVRATPVAAGTSASALLSASPEADSAVLDRTEVKEDHDGATGQDDFVNLGDCGGQQAAADKSGPAEQQLKALEERAAAAEKRAAAAEKETAAAKALLQARNDEPFADEVSQLQRAQKSDQEVGISSGYDLMPNSSAQVFPAPAPGAFPTDIEEWVQKLGLRPDPQRKLLVLLTGDRVGATELQEVAELEPEEVEKIKDTLPSAKRTKFLKAVSQLRKAAIQHPDGGTETPPVHCGPFGAILANGPDEKLLDSCVLEAETKLKKIQEQREYRHTMACLPTHHGLLEFPARVHFASLFGSVGKQRHGDADLAVSDPKALVDLRVSVQWARGMRYLGVVKSYDPENGLHHVHYDDGEKKWYNMQEKTFWIIDVAEDGQRTMKNAKEEMLDLMARFDQRLSVEMQQLVWAHLCKKEHLHDAIMIADKKQLDIHVQEARVKGMIRRLMSQNDIISLSARATTTSAIAIGTQCLVEGFQGFHYMSAGDAVSGLAAFMFLTALEVARWAYDPHYTKQALMVNVGEHAWGTASSAIGCWGGFKVGLAAGSCFAHPLTGAILGMLFGGFGLDLCIRKCYRYLITDPKIKDEERAQQEAKQELIEDQFRMLGINRTDNFRTAQKKFRQLIVLNHPDKVTQRRREFKTEDDFNAAFQRATATSQALLCAWVLVRKEYEIDDEKVYTEAQKDSQSGFYPEGYLKIFCKKFKENRGDRWRTVKAWFSESSDNDPELGERQTERGYELVTMEKIFV